MIAPTSRQLCASLVATKPLSSEQLRSWLADILPGYAVPERYQQLDEMPLIENGKLDRRALQQRAEQQWLFTERCFNAPQGTIEQQVADLWQLLLQVKAVGHDDNFFVLDGDSLIATRLIAQMLENSSLLRYLSCLPRLRWRGILYLRHSVATHCRAAAGRKQSRALSAFPAQRY